MIRPTGRSTLFPYTTLFRSDLHRRNNIESIVSRERSVGDERRRTTAGGGVHRAKCAGKRRGSVNAVVIDVPYAARQATDRKSTRLNSSPLGLSYVVFC